MVGRRHPTHTKRVGTTQDPTHTSGHQRGGREAEIGVQAASTAMQSAGRSSALYTGRHAFGGRGDWGGGGETEAAFESASEEGGRGLGTGRAEWFFFFCFLSFLFSANWREGDQGGPLYDSHAGRGQDMGIPVKVFMGVWIFCCGDSVRRGRRKKEREREGRGELPARSENLRKQEIRGALWGDPPWCSISLSLFTAPSQVRASKHHRK